ncbi:hypothetical protein GmHk_01G002667 [Glycine max]|nr:hypothetical protein GmHk_01G002667 [Glycine max]
MHYKLQQHPKYQIRQNSSHDSSSFMASMPYPPQHITLNPPAYPVMSRGIRLKAEKKLQKDDTHREMV